MLQHGVCAGVSTSVPPTLPGGISAEQAAFSGSLHQIWRESSLSSFAVPDFLVAASRLSDSNLGRLLCFALPCLAQLSLMKQLQQGVNYKTRISPLLWAKTNPPLSAAIEGVSSEPEKNPKIKINTVKLWNT